MPAEQLRLYRLVLLIFPEAQLVPIAQRFVSEETRAPAAETIPGKLQGSCLGCGSGMWRPHFHIPTVKIMRQRVCAKSCMNLCHR